MPTSTSKRPALENLSLALGNLLDNLIETDTAITRGLADDLQQLAR